MRAVQEGYKFAMENPDEAAECLLELAPELDRELVVKSQKYLASKYQDDAPYWGMQKRSVGKVYELAFTKMNSSLPLLMWKKHLPMSFCKESKLINEY